MEVINYVKEFLNLNDINDIVLSEDIKEGSLATYSFDSKTLEINQDGIMKKAESLNISLGDTVCLLVSHELGHYLDPELENLYNKKKLVFEKIENDIFSCNFESVITEGVSYVMEAEKNAWSIGEKFVPQRLRKLYKQMEFSTLRAQEIETSNEFGKFIELVLKMKKLSL